jgi:hypothetical protein
MGALLQDGLADGTVGRNITLTLTLTLKKTFMCAVVTLVMSPGRGSTPRQTD